MKHMWIKPLMIILLIATAFLPTGFSESYNPLRGNVLLICEHDQAWSTSMLKGTAKNPVMYHADNICDGNMKTAWAEGVPGPGIGVKIIFEIPTPGYSVTTLKDGARTMIVYNGLVASKNLFLANNRVRDCTLEVFVGVDSGVYENYCSKHTLKKFSGVTLRLGDTMEPQRFPLNIDYSAAKNFWRVARNELRAAGNAVSEGEYGRYIYGVLTIRSVYKGTRYDDTCLTEIAFE